MIITYKRTREKDTHLTWADLPLVSERIASVSAGRATDTLGGCCGSLILTSLLPKRLKESSRSSWSLRLARPTGPDDIWYTPSMSVSDVPLPSSKQSLSRDCEKKPVFQINRLRRNKLTRSSALSRQ